MEPEINIEEKKKLKRKFSIVVYVYVAVIFIAGISGPYNYVFEVLAIILTFYILRLFLKLKSNDTRPMDEKKKDQKLILKKIAPAIILGILITDIVLFSDKRMSSWIILASNIILIIMALITLKIIYKKI